MKVLKIGNEDIEVGKLSYKAVKSLPIFMVNLVKDLQDTKFTNNNFDDFLLIADKLSEEKIAELYKLLLKDKSADWIIDNVLGDMAIAYDILVAVYDHNEKIFKPFIDAMKKSAPIGVPESASTGTEKKNAQLDTNPQQIPHC